MRMSTFESEDFRWRETYFVLFESSRRPPLRKVEQTIARLKDRFELSHPSADETGSFESLTVMAPDDYAALDISYVEGEEVVEQVQQLMKDLKTTTLQPGDLEKLARLPKCDARFDIMHFEQVLEGGEEGDEMLDPSALLLVMDALAKLTGGVGIDPASGALM
jgi:hypothetical protein